MPVFYIRVVIYEAFDFEVILSKIFNFLLLQLKPNIKHSDANTSGDFHEQQTLLVLSQHILWLSWSPDLSKLSMMVSLEAILPATIFWRMWAWSSSDRCSLGMGTSSRTIIDIYQPGLWIRIHFLRIQLIF